MQRSLINRWGVPAVFALVILMNYLSNALPINNITMSQISADYPTLFTPDGLTFAVWLLIYVALFGYAVFQSFPAQKTDPVLAKISSVFIINGLANSAWILTWHYGLKWLSLGIMIVIFITLFKILTILWNAGKPLSLKERVFVALPFSLYAGWITAATIANASIVQSAMGWQDVWMSEINWTYLKLALAGTFGAVMACRKQNIAFVLVIGWAAWGIARKQVETPEVAGAATVLACLALILTCIAVAEFFGPLRKRERQAT